MEENDNEPLEEIDKENELRTISSIRKTRNKSNKGYWDKSETKEQPRDFTTSQILGRCRIVNYMHP